MRGTTTTTPTTAAAPEDRITALVLGYELILSWPLGEIGINECPDLTLCGRADHVPDGGNVREVGVWPREAK